MFGRFPKTSMCNLIQIKDFILSGGVDGYVYIWRISALKCCRALKVSDSEIVSMGVKGKCVLFGCSQVC